MNDKLR